MERPQEPEIAEVNGSPEAQLPPELKAETGRLDQLIGDLSERYDLAALVEPWTPYMPTVTEKNAGQFIALTCLITRAEPSVIVSALMEARISENKKFKMFEIIKEAIDPAGIIVHFVGNMRVETGVRKVKKLLPLPDHWMVKEKDEWIEKKGHTLAEYEQRQLVFEKLDKVFAHGVVEIPDPKRLKQSSKVLQVFEDQTLLYAELAAAMRISETSLPAPEEPLLVDSPYYHRTYERLLGDTAVPRMVAKVNKWSIDRDTTLKEAESEMRDIEAENIPDAPLPDTDLELLAFMAPLPDPLEGRLMLLDGYLSQLAPDLSLNTADMRYWRHLLKDYARDIDPNAADALERFENLAVHAYCEAIDNYRAWTHLSMQDNGAEPVTLRRVLDYELKRIASRPPKVVPISSEVVIPDEVPTELPSTPVEADDLLARRQNRGRDSQRAS